MTELRSLNVEDVMARAASALSRVSRGAVRLERVQPVSKAERRNLIARAVAVDEAGRTRPVIVKATRSADYDPTAENALEASGLVRKWVATAHLSERAAGRQHGSALLAGDVEAGVLVFEDLGEGLGSLVDPLLGGTAEDAERALMSYATALARLHAWLADLRGRWPDAEPLGFYPAFAATPEPALII